MGKTRRRKARWVMEVRAKVEPKGADGETGRLGEKCSAVSPGLKVATSPSRPFAGGDLACAGHGDRIDVSVCIVRSFRQPEKCGTCQFAQVKGGNR